MEYTACLKFRLDKGPIVNIYRTKENVGMACPKIPDFSCSLCFKSVGAQCDRYPAKAAREGRVVWAGEPTKGPMIIS